MIGYCIGSVTDVQNYFGGWQTVCTMNQTLNTTIKQQGNSHQFAPIVLPG